jgi:hypothetical protein
MNAMRRVAALTLTALVIGYVPPAFAGSLEVTLPNGWTRVHWRLTSTTVPRQVYAAASFPLRRSPRGDCGTSVAVRAQMPMNSLIVLIEDWGPLPGKAYPPLERPVDLGRTGNSECFGWSYNVPFGAAGRRLQAFVLARGHPGAVRLNQARELLASVPAT